MLIRLREFGQVTIALGLSALLLVSAGRADEHHIVSRAELQSEAVAASQARQHNIDSVRRFLSSPTAEEAIKSAKMDPRQVCTAVASLDDHDLQQLAARAGQAQADFAAGGLNTIQLALLIVLVAVLILVLVSSRVPF
ncbi:MAG: hypothetical protein LAO20_19415 [Acidobacteriia bacterium]|nr:hypothetical protein [Terriglobia bacterium]